MALGFVDYYAVLEVLATASRDEVLTALREKRGRWEFLRDSVNPDEVQRQLAILDDAERVLLTPSLRSEYDKEYAARTHASPDSARAPTVDDAAAGQRWVMMAKDALAAGDLDRAAYAAREALHVYPDDGETWSLRGQISLARNQPTDAIVEFEQAIVINPGDDRSVYRLGVAYQAVGKLGPAMVNYLKASQLNPLPTVYRAAWANSLAAGGFGTTAVPTLEAVVAEEPDNALYRGWLARALSEAGAERWTRLPDGIHLPTTTEQATSALELWRRAAALNFDDPALRDELDNRMLRARQGLAWTWRHSASRTVLLIAVAWVVGWAIDRILGHVDGLVSWTALVLIVLMSGFRRRLYVTASYARRKFGRQVASSTRRGVFVGIAAVIVVAALVIAVGGVSHRAASDSSGAQHVGSAATTTPPSVGALTARTDGRYNVDLLASHYDARPYEDNLDGTPEGLEFTLSDGFLELPIGQPGSYSACIGGTYRETFRITVPWSHLRPGMQFCDKTTYSGLHVTLITVLSSPVSDSVRLRITTWDCPAAPGKSIC